LFTEKSAFLIVNTKGENYSQLYQRKLRYQ